MPRKTPKLPEKASEQVRVRMGRELKVQLQEALAAAPYFNGNLSEFVNECARAYVVQSRRGENVLTPLEFLSK